MILPSNLVAIAVIVAIYKLCGINHIDGLADFGDGVIAHGTWEKKVQAMKDVNLGTGGGLFIAVLLLATFAVVTDIPQRLLPLALLIGRGLCQGGHDLVCGILHISAKGFWADHD